MSKGENIFKEKPDIVLGETEYCGGQFREIAPEYGALEK